MFKTQLKSHVARWARAIFLAGIWTVSATAGQASAELQVAVFEIDASPPIGSLMAYDEVQAVQTPLSCRGIVLLGSGEPIVLAAIDWIGIGNDGHKQFCRHLAEGADTAVDRVSLHALHQHDAPRCDFSVENILQQEGVDGPQFDPEFCRRFLSQLRQAIADAVQRAQTFDHIGLAEAKVEQVASNRRILGPDGKVQYTRFTATRDPKIRAFPAGTIDPYLKLIVFYRGDRPLVALTYYATHPQSYYRTGLANPDFPGLARNQRDAATGVLHVHFNGAGGNVGAGKWNDGAKANRQVLADRLAAGMRLAWERVQPEPITTDDIGWEAVPVQLPVADHLDEDLLLQVIRNPTSKRFDRHNAANDLAWLRRCQAGDAISIGCLRLGRGRVLHLPGELFVEYQLLAQQLRPDLFVALAAYGDYAPGYIGTRLSYTQGGYEVSPRATNVTPAVEAVLVTALQQLLDADPARDVDASTVTTPE